MANLVLENNFGSKEQLEINAKAMLRQVAAALGASDEIKDVGHSCSTDDR